MSLLEIRDASFRYGAGRYVFKGVSFSLEAGRVLCILGPNGAGKSTLLNCLAGLLELEEGEITLEGKSPKTLGPRGIAGIIGYVPQRHVPAYGYTVRDFVVMGRAPHIGIFSAPDERDYELAMGAIVSMGIERLADRPYTEISAGERQQATIARVLAQQPRLIMMDEPTSSLDYGNQMLVLETVRRLSSNGYGVIMTTHTPDHAIMLDDAAALLDRSGRLRTGQAGAVLREDLLKEIYRANLKLVFVEEAGRPVCIPLSNL